MLDLTRRYTLEDRENLADEIRTEYENGYLVMMSSPIRSHQLVSGWVERKIGNYLEGKSCTVYQAPVDVDIFNDGSYIYQPDIFIMCSEDNTDDGIIHGTPDWICEIVSGNSARDYIIKYRVYKSAGVKEYWILNVHENSITVCDLTTDDLEHYTFDDRIQVGVLKDLSLDMSKCREFVTSKCNVVFGK